MPKRSRTNFPISISGTLGLSFSDVACFAKLAGLRAAPLLISAHCGAFMKGCHTGLTGWWIDRAHQSLRTVGREEVGEWGVWRGLDKVMGGRREGMRWGQKEGGGKHPKGFRSVIDSTGNKQPSPGGGSRIWGLEETAGRGWSGNSKLSNLLHNSQRLITWTLQ